MSGRSAARQVVWLWFAVAEAPDFSRLVGDGPVKVEGQLGLLTSRPFLDPLPAGGESA